jgi:fructokinase
LHSLGQNVVVVSAVGDDELGAGIRQHLGAMGISDRYVQTTASPTGTVQVSLDEHGAASYEIIEPVAWDNIDCSPDLLDLVSGASLFVFGSLAARSKGTRETMLALIEAATYRVFDVNLRPPHYNVETIQHLLGLAQFVKFNDEELIEFTEDIFEPGASLEERAHYVSKTYDLDKICVTLGAEGAFLMQGDDIYRSEGFAVDVIDTVGAGDSFLGTLLHFLQTGTPAAKAIRLACAMGAMVAGRAGATPYISESELRAFSVME